MLNPTKCNHTISIADNDTDVFTPFAELIYEEDFEGLNAVGWNPVPHPFYTNLWTIDYCAMPSKSASVSKLPPSYIPECGYQQATGGTDMVIFREINASGFRNISVEFEWQFEGNANDYGALVYSDDVGATWQTVATLNGESKPTVSAFGLPNALDSSTFLIGWKFIENGDNITNSNNTFAFDNIKVRGLPYVELAQTLNQQATAYLGPFSTVGFHDATTGQLIAQIENTSAHDYGCTSIEIDRVGTGATELWNAGIEYGVMPKTVYISPTYNNPNGTYFITLFYTQPELGAWLSAVNANTNSIVRTENDLILAKTGGNISNISPITPHANGVSTNQLSTNHSRGVLAGLRFVRGYFDSGFSGIAIGTPSSPPPANPLPISLIRFEGRNIGRENLLIWETAQEINNSHFVLEKSVNATDFSPIAQINGQGNTKLTTAYEFTDSEIARIAYYRLKQVDFDGEFSFSKIIELKFATWEKPMFVAFPNPFSEYISISPSPQPFSWLSQMLREFQFVKVIMVATPKRPSSRHNFPKEFISFGLSRMESLG